VDHASRLEYYSAGALATYDMSLKFAKQSLRRVSFPIAGVIGARLVTLAGGRPRATMLGPEKPDTDQFGDPIELGKLPDLDEPREGDGRSPPFSPPGVFELAGGDVEDLGMLVLEFSEAGGGVTSTAAPVAPKKNKRYRYHCADWTPGASASTARRHYIVGDASEMTELARFLAAESSHMASLLRVAPDQGAEEIGSGVNSVSDDFDPLSTSPGAALPLPPPPPSPPEKRLPFKDTAAVKAILPRCGVSGSANPCLLAGILNGNVPVADEYTTAEDPSEFLRTVVGGVDCPECSMSRRISVKSLLDQPTWGGGDKDEEGALQCSCGTGSYITNVCGGSLQAVSGNSHNHCEVRPLSPGVASAAVNHPTCLRNATTSASASATTATRTATRAATITSPVCQGSRADAEPDGTRAMVFFGRERQWWPRPTSTTLVRLRKRRGRVARRAFRRGAMWRWWTPPRS